MEHIPDEVIEIARQTFPGMNDMEIMTMLLEGNDDDVRSMVNTAVDRGSAGGSGGDDGFNGGNGVNDDGRGRSWQKSPGSAVSQVPPQGMPQRQRTKRPPFRDAPPVLYSGQGQDAEQTQSEVVPVITDVNPQPLPPPAPPPNRSLVEELAAMTPEEKEDLRILMASVGLPDITKGLPEGFDPMSYPAEVQELAKIIQTGFEPAVQQQQQKQPQPKPQPQPQPAPQPPQSKAPVSPPTNLRSLIPPRPKSQIPKYSPSQLSTPHNPIYTYDISLLNHADPLHTLESSPHSRFPPLPPALTRYTLNNPSCIPPTSSPFLSGPPRFPDCGQAISNIPLHLPSSKCHMWPIPKQVISEFGTCRIVVKNENAKAGCPELEKVKHLAGRVLKMCAASGGEKEVGGWRKNSKEGTVEGKVGYLFVNEDLGGWDIMEIGVERVTF